MALTKQIAELQRRILMLKLKTPYHPDLQTLLLELDGLIQSTKQDQPTGQPTTPSQAG